VCKSICSRKQAGGHGKRLNVEIDLFPRVSFLIVTSCALLFARRRFRMVPSKASFVFCRWSIAVRKCLDQSARSVLIRKMPRQKAGLKSYEISPARQNCPGQRIASYAHFVARRSFLLKRRQAFQQALLQRAAKPNFFLSRRNTLSQTLQPFGTRCQPCRCLRSSPVPSVVSATESNPTQSVSPSSFLPPRCHPMVSMRRFPI